MTLVGFDSGQYLEYEGSDSKDWEEGPSDSAGEDAADAKDDGGDEQHALENKGL